MGRSGRRVAAVLAAVVLAGSVATSASATHEPARCPMHVPHTGAHARASCQMTRLGAVEISTTAGLGQIEVRGNLAAVVQREQGFVALVDVSDPASPRVLGRYDGNTGRPELDDSFDGDVVFSSDGRYLFYARQTHQFSLDGLHVIDVSNPAEPSLVQYLPGGGTLRVAYHRDGDEEYVITADAVAGIMVFRFLRSGGAAALVPVHVDSQPLLKVGGPASAGLYVDPDDPVLHKPLLYVTTGETGLQVFDFSDPASPVLLGVWATSGLADFEVDATASGRTVYAATEYWFTPSTPPRIVVLNATNLGAIGERERFSPGTPDYASGVSWRLQGIELSGGLLYVAHSHGGVGVIDTCCLGAEPRGSSNDLGDGNTGGEFPSGSNHPYAMDLEVSGGVVWVTDAATGTLSAFEFDPTLDHE